MSAWYLRIIKETDDGHEKIVDHQIYHNGAEDKSLKIHWDRLLESPRCLEAWLIRQDEERTVEGVVIDPYDSVLVWINPNRNGK